MTNSVRSDSCSHSLHFPWHEYPDYKKVMKAFHLSCRTEDFFLFSHKTHTAGRLVTEGLQWTLLEYFSEHVMLHPLLLSFLSFFSQDDCCTHIFSHRLCSLVMQFSALHDSHRAARGFSHTTPQAKKDKVCSMVIHLLPVSEDRTQC